jgi:hypothetical protein
VTETCSSIRWWLLGFWAVESGKNLPTFQRSLLPPSSGKSNVGKLLPDYTAQHIRCRENLKSHLIQFCCLYSLAPRIVSPHIWSKAWKRYMSFIQKTYRPVFNQWSWSMNYEGQERKWQRPISKYSVFFCSFLHKRKCHIQRTRPSAVVRKATNVIWKKAFKGLTNLTLIKVRGKSANLRMDSSTHVFMQVVRGKSSSIKPR